MNIEFTHVLPASTDLGPVEDSRIVEEHGLDAVVLDAGRDSLATMAQAERVLCSSTVGKVIVAHWVGDMEPVRAAQAFARLAGGSDRVAVSLRANRGPGLAYAARIDQLDEYATLLKRLWLSDRPFEHQGSHYSLSCTDCGTKASIQLRIGGRSGLIQNVAAQLAETFDLPAGDLADTAATIARITGFAAERGRAPHLGFAMPVALDDETAELGIGLSGEPLKDALVLLDHFEAGIGEFVLHGSDRAVATFAREVMPLVRNSVSRRFDRASNLLAPRTWPLEVRGN